MIQTYTPRRGERPRYGEIPVRVLELADERHAGQVFVQMGVQTLWLPIATLNPPVGWELDHAEGQAT